MAREIDPIKAYNSESKMTLYCVIEVFASIFKIRLELSSKTVVTNLSYLVQYVRHWYRKLFKILFSKAMINR